MSYKSLMIVVVVLMGGPLIAQVQRFLPTSQVVKIAGMAARDEGYNPESSNVFLDNLRRKDGSEPISGYASIGLYKDDHLVQSFSIRIATGDVVDATSCKIFRYPDLLQMAATIVKSFGTSAVSLDTIAFEVGCDHLRVIETDQSTRAHLHAPHRTRHSTAAYPYALHEPDTPPHSTVSSTLP